MEIKMFFLIYLAISLVVQYYFFPLNSCIYSLKLDGLMSYYFLPFFFLHLTIQSLIQICQHHPFSQLMIESKYLIYFPFFIWIWISVCLGSSQITFVMICFFKHWKAFLFLEAQMLFPFPLSLFKIQINLFLQILKAYLVFLNLAPSFSLIFLFTQMHCFFYKDFLFPYLHQNVFKSFLKISYLIRQFYSLSLIFEVLLLRSVSLYYCGPLQLSILYHLTVLSFSCYCRSDQTVKFFSFFSLVLTFYYFSLLILQAQSWSYFFDSMTLLYYFMYSINQF